MRNNAPVMKDSLNLTIGEIYVTKSFKYTIWY